MFTFRLCLPCDLRQSFSFGNSSSCHIQERSPRNPTRCSPSFNRASQAAIRVLRFGLFTRGSSEYPHWRLVAAAYLVNEWQRLSGSQSSRWTARAFWLIESWLTELTGWHCWLYGELVAFRWLLWFTKSVNCIEWDTLSWMHHLCTPTTSASECWTQQPILLPGHSTNVSEKDIGGTSVWLQQNIRLCDAAKNHRPSKLQRSLHTLLSV